ncbi:MAG: hypothetical protein ABFD52_09040 [Acidobacteriota bacterium]
MTATRICKLAYGDEIIDGNAVCTIYEIQKASLLGGARGGSGRLQLLNALPFLFTEIVGKQFYLIFDPAAIIEDFGRVEKMPIFFEEVHSTSLLSLDFRIGNIRE